MASSTSDHLCVTSVSPPGLLSPPVSIELSVRILSVKVTGGFPPFSIASDRDTSLWASTVWIPHMCPISIGGSLEMPLPTDPGFTVPQVGSIGLVKVGSAFGIAPHRIACHTCIPIAALWPLHGLSTHQGFYPRVRFVLCSEKLTCLLWNYNQKPRFQDIPIIDSILAGWPMFYSRSVCFPFWLFRRELASPETAQ